MMKEKGAVSAPFISAATGSPIIVPTIPPPVAIAAEPARAVVGPDDAAVARIVVIGIIAAIDEVAAVEEEAAVRKVRIAVAAETMEAAAMPASTREGVESTTVESSAMKAAAMETATTMEAAAAMEAAAMEAPTTMEATTAANLYPPFAHGLRRRSAGCDQRQRLCALTARQRKRERRGRGKREAADKSKCPDFFHE